MYTLQQTYLTLLAADRTFAESRTCLNLHRLLHAQRTYYVTLTRYAKDNLTPQEARHLRAANMVKRAQQNRHIANTMWNDDQLPITTIRNWGALATNQWHRARYILAQITMDIELSTTATTPQTGRPRTKPQPTTARVRHPITHRYVTLTTEQHQHYMETGTWPQPQPQP